MTQAPEPQPTRAGSFRSARTLFRVRGVPVRVDASWLIIAGLVAWIFYGYMGASPAMQPVGEVGLVLSAGVASVLFFASLLAHELGHAFTSLDRDIPVLGITLFLMGGVTESTREAESAKDEFVIVGIGPFISLLLAAAFGLVHLAVEGIQPLATIVGYLAWTNLLLAVFNLVPGYPLDGGRLLRSVLWGLTKQPHKATRWAARVGQVFAAGLIAFGVWLLLRSGGGVNGLWEILIGVFLFKGAWESHKRARFRERLAGRTASTVMGSVPPALDPNSTLREALREIQTRPSLLWPVGRPIRGVVTLGDIDAVPEERWDTTTVAEVAHPAAGAVVAPDDQVSTILELIVRAPEHMLVVARDGEPVGLITPSLLMEPTAG
jgi:Zn-dependent protease/CBS domain-containing protein